MKEFSDDPRVEFVLDLKDPSVNPYELRKTIGGLSTNRFVLFGTQACMNSLPNVEKENKGKNLYTLGVRHGAQRKISSVNICFT